ITTKKDLQELNKKVIEIGEKAGIPVCATSDAHYLFAEYARDSQLGKTGENRIPSAGIPSDDGGNAGRIQLSAERKSGGDRH
ncbi:hypothetical protein OSK06_26330, partial [Escherichia coli]|nr:hypothetical protein [Escherichia coli]